MADQLDPSARSATFDFDYFFRRRKAGTHPVPALGRLRATVRQAILTPGVLQGSGKAKTAKQSC